MGIVSLLEEEEEDLVEVGEEDVVVGEEDVVEEVEEDVVEEVEEEDVVVEDAEEDDGDSFITSSIDKTSNNSFVDIAYLPIEY